MLAHAILYGQSGRDMIKVGDLVRITNPLVDATSPYSGQVGIVTKVPVGIRGKWVILLASGEIVATMGRSRLEVISAQ